MFVLLKTPLQVFCAADVVLIVFELENVDVMHGEEWYIEQPHFALRVVERRTKIAAHTAQVWAELRGAHFALVKKKCGLPREARRSERSVVDTLGKSLHRLEKLILGWAEQIRLCRSG